MARQATSKPSSGTASSYPIIGFEVGPPLRNHENGHLALYGITSDFGSTCCRGRNHAAQGPSILISLPNRLQ